MNRQGTQIYKVWRNRKGLSEKTDDPVVVEEPLEIQLGLPVGGNIISTSIAVTMRTPGADKFLAAGFLFTEGILNSPDEIEDIIFPKTKTPIAKGNLIRFNLKKGTKVDLKKTQRNFYATSSCGVCGKASIKAVNSLAEARNPDFFDNKKSESSSGFSNKIKAEILFSLPEILFAKQNLFRKTGGIHAAALFDFEGNLENLQEDVGRHNALDKLIGKFFLEHNLPLSGKILLVSGRLGFELVQKSIAANISVIAAVGAPTSLAIDLAKSASITVIGFLKNEKFNVYVQ